MKSIISVIAEFPIWFKIVTSLVTLIGAIWLALSRFHASKREKVRRKLADDEYAGKFLKQFNDSEIRRWMKDYVVPHCSSFDPTNRDGDEYLADIRQNIFEHMDHNIEKRDKRYNLLLADTGMGKTMFCINYYAHLKKRFRDLNVCLVSLASENSINIIRSVSNKSDTILIADAFDEDNKAVGRGRQRLSEILEAAADFKTVIITCRSQYFIADDAIPRETPLPVLVPRKLGQSQNSALVRSYISPFGKTEVEQYLAKIFPLYKPWLIKYRRRGKQLIETVPDLVHRPMLLERLPEIARTPSQDAELYELYDLLVSGWMNRENRWISFENLKTVSLELAIIMYRDFSVGHGRMALKDVNAVAENLVQKNPEWEHLSSRSLLNRDSSGMYKFAHKSVMEFLVVKAACEGDDRAFATPWTAFMKELFISWGHSASGKMHWKRARSILSSENGRRHIAPFYDMLATNAVRGYPDFKQVCGRRSTSTGERIAPASWRESAIEIEPADGKTIIKDLEYNLRWAYIPNRASPDIAPLRITDILLLQNAHSSFRFPSFEQSVALIEGLYSVKRDFIKSGTRFIIGDRPSKNTYLIIEVNTDAKFDQNIRLLWEGQRITGTPIHLNCYQLESHKINSVPKKFRVDQLYIDDRSDTLFDMDIN